MCTNQGFTLIEALVSLVILAVILLGLQSGLMMSISLNTENMLREEAINIAQEHMQRYRTEDGAPPNIENVTRQVRNFQVTYTVDNTGYDSSSHVLDMAVQWNFKGETRTLNYSSHIGG